MILPNFAATWLDNIAARFGYCVYGCGVCGLPWWHPRRYFMTQITFVKMAEGERRVLLKPYDPSKPLEPLEAGFTIIKNDGSLREGQAGYIDL